MTRAAPPWGPWRIFPDWSPSAAVLAETLDGGQSFRWAQSPDGVWTGSWGDCAAQLRLNGAGVLAWRAPEPLEARAAGALPRYLGAGLDWPALADALPWRSDAHLARCMADFRGLRLLRQPLGETLLGFLCSATKQIGQIKQMVALLAQRHGTPLVKGADFLRLPDWTALAAIPEKELRACRLGFRARHIAATARFLAGNPGWLGATEAAPYPAARARLMELPGVGAKVADCVLLFGAGRLEAFPVDTWILKSLARRYGLTGWKPAQAAHFGRAHFGPLAGYAQQYLFAWERRHGGHRAGG